MRKLLTKYGTIELPTLYRMIYYSHINEDNRVERKLLEQTPCDTVVAVCGSGERVLSLMDNKNCTRFFVVDNNEEAIYLLQLKLEALKQLSVDDYLRFIGHADATKNDRIEVFETLRQNLPPKTKDYWELNKKRIGKGILYAGHFERFLDRIRPLTNLYLGNGFQQIFKQDYKEKTFPKRRWKLLQTLFSYKLSYQMAGNTDIAFVGQNTQTQQIPRSLNETITANKASSSFMAHLIFKRTLSEMCEKELPPSLQKNVLLGIRNRLLQNEIDIYYYACDLLEFVATKEILPDSNVFYSISDILSFVDFTYLKTFLTKIPPGRNLIAGRSFLRNRLTTDQLKDLEFFGTVAIHDDEESTRMYQVFSINTATK